MQIQPIDTVASVDGVRLALVVVIEIKSGVENIFQFRERTIGFAVPCVSPVVGDGSEIDMQERLRIMQF